MKKTPALFAASILSLAGLTAHAAETYSIDPTHTFASFEINHLGFSTFRGRFDSTAGTVEIDFAKQVAVADISIDVNSVSTGVAKLDAHLKAADFFDVAKYPSIQFKSTKAEFREERLVALTGDLTMHGVTKPVTLAVQSVTCKDHPMKKTPACGADAFVVLKRSDWGISTYVPAVGDEVRVEIEVEAHLHAP